MVTLTHAVYVDESGHGAPVNELNRLWVSAGVAISLEQKQVIDDGVDALISNHYHQAVKELKGARITHELRSGTTIDKFTLDLAGILQAVEARIWVVATIHGVNPLRRLGKKKQLPKDIVRQLLLERVNGDLRKHPDDSYFLLWDISDVTELIDFSKNVATFRNIASGELRNPRLEPAVLGGLSHDWKGLQIADIIANFALNRVGELKKVPGVNKEKVRAFNKHIKPLLTRGASGRISGCGWKVY